MKARRKVDSPTKIETYKKINPVYYDPSLNQ